MRVVVLMGVVVQLGLVEQEEKNQPHQQRGKQLLRASLAFKGFRQQVHEGCGQQRTGGQTQHVRGVAGQQAKTQQRRQPHAAYARNQCAKQNCYQCHSFLRPFYKGCSPKNYINLGQGR